MRALLKLIKAIDNFYLVTSGGLKKIAQDTGTLVMNLKKWEEDASENYPDLSEELKELRSQYDVAVKRFNSGRPGGKTFSSIMQFAISTYLGNKDIMDEYPDLAEVVDSVINDLNSFAQKANESESKSVYDQYTKAKGIAAPATSTEESGEEAAPEGQAQQKSDAEIEAENQIYEDCPEPCRNLLSILPFLSDEDLVNQLRVLARMYATAVKMNAGFGVIHSAANAATEYIQNMTSDYNEDSDEVPPEFQEYLTVEPILGDIKADIRSKTGNKPIGSLDTPKSIEVLKRILSDFHRGEFNKADSAKAREEAEKEPEAKIPSKDKETMGPSQLPNVIYDTTGGTSKEQASSGFGTGQRFISLADNIDWVKRYQNEKQNYLELLDNNPSLVQKRNIEGLAAIFDKLIQLSADEKEQVKRVKLAGGALSKIDDRIREDSKQIIETKDFIDKNQKKLTEKQLAELIKLIATLNAAKKENRDKIKELLKLPEEAGGPSKVERDYFETKEKIRVAKEEKARAVILVRNFNLDSKNKEYSSALRVEPDNIKKEILQTKIEINNLLQSKDTNKSKAYYKLVQLLNLLQGKVVEIKKGKGKGMRGMRMSWWSTEAQELSAAQKTTVTQDAIDRLKAEYQEARKEIKPYQERRQKATTKIVDKKKTITVTDPVTGKEVKFTDWASVRLEGYEEHLSQAIGNERSELKKKVKAAITTVVTESISKDPDKVKHYSNIYEAFLLEIQKSEFDKANLIKAIKDFRAKLKADLLKHRLFREYSLSVIASRRFRKLANDVLALHNAGIDTKHDRTPDEIEAIHRAIKEAEYLNDRFKDKEIGVISRGRPLKPYLAYQLNTIQRLIPYLYDSLARGADAGEDISNEEPTDEAPPIEGQDEQQV